MRKITIILLTFTIFSIFVGCILYIPGGGLLQTVNVAEEHALIIDKGQSTFSIAKVLTEQKVISNNLGFFAGVMVLKLMQAPLRYGEYLIKPNQNLWKVLQKISRGDVVVHQLTFPEGLTVYEIAQKLEGITILTGNIEQLPPEGTLLPETYDYRYGDSRQQIVNRMIKAMENLKDLLWKQHQNHCLLNNWHEVLVLASIVEKETSLGMERNLVASVYLNRLQIHMPLQADPTVIYAITNGQTSFYRPILKADLAVASPYNTYLQTGLPPTPIACPGRASIMAVLEPASTSYLYFVANGTGGHEFSSNLNAHNRNVRHWRTIK